ncbi:MAG: acetyl-CoA synthetase, partial [Candidimonas sp.]
RLKGKVPEFGATRNPIDLSGAILTQESLFEEVLNLFAQARNLDGFAIISTYIRNPAFAHAIVRMYRVTDKPVVVCWTGSAEQTPESLAILTESGIPIYGNTGRVALAFRAIRGDTDIA